MFVMHIIRSALVEAVGYDRKTQELHVALVGRGTYVYEEVDETVMNLLLKAESKGDYFNANIRDRYRFRRS